MFVSVGGVVFAKSVFCWNSGRNYISYAYMYDTWQAMRARWGFLFAPEHRSVRTCHMHLHDDLLVSDVFLAALRLCPVYRNK